MTWSYDTALTAAKDKVRFYVQDTDTNDQLIQNEEITFALSEKGQNISQTAALVAELIARQFAKLVTTKVGDTQVNYSDRAAFYWQLAQDLRTRSIAVGPFVGGISVANKAVYDAESDRVRPLFAKDQFVVPGTGVSEETSDTV